MMKPEKFDVDLGEGHWLQWVEFEGVRCGGVIRHLSTSSETGLCAGVFWINERYNAKCGTNHPVWRLSGSDAAPTLTPSFMRHCGDHGLVRDGKWVCA